MRGTWLLALLLTVMPLAAGPAAAADGEMRWGLHVTLAARRLDPAETEAFNTPFMVLYAIHDALVNQVVEVPIYELAFLWGVGPRVDEAAAGLIPGFAYSAPFEDLRLKK